ncbi:MAG: hypothetical protein PVSMB4_01240 [Ktedonobacterales bacterium]
MTTEQQSLVSRIKALAEALEGSEVAELDLAEQGTRIMLRRRLEPTIIAPPRPGSNGVYSARGARARSVGDQAISAPDPTVAIIAPLTGVFYSSPSPSSPPFVQVGETIQAGQIVSIVEAMKVFNEIKSEISGTVTAILAQSGQLVHKGDALVRVKPV